MMFSDKELIKVYLDGFHDELAFRPNAKYENKIQNRAYVLGRNHARMDTDELPKDKELLFEIRGFWRTLANAILTALGYF